MVRRRKIPLSYLKRQYKWGAIACLLLIGLIISTRGAYGMYKKSTETQGKAATVHTAVRQLQERHDRAKGHAEMVASDRGMDREIRERYGVKKPGEGVIILVQEKQDQNSSSEEDNKGNVEIDSQVSE